MEINGKKFVLLCLCVLFVFLVIIPFLSRYDSVSMKVLLTFFIVISGLVLLGFYSRFLLNSLSKNMKRIYHWMAENKKMVVYIFIGLVLFLWFAVRPAIIKSSCANKYDYQRCVHSYGL